MATQAEDDYDKLTPEQREVRDKEDRAREAAEQASMWDLSPTMRISNLIWIIDLYSITLHLETRVGRRRYCCTRT